MTAETISGQSGPVAVGTNFGMGDNADQLLVSNHHTEGRGITDKELDNTLRSFCELESHGPSDVLCPINMTALSG